MGFLLASALEFCILPIRCYTEHYYSGECDKFWGELEAWGDLTRATSTVMTHIVDVLILKRIKFLVDQI